MSCGREGDTAGISYRYDYEEKYIRVEKDDTKQNKFSVLLRYVRIDEASSVVGR